MSLPNHQADSDASSLAMPKDIFFDMVKLCVNESVQHAAKAAAKETLERLFQEKVAFLNQEFDARQERLLTEAREAARKKTMHLLTSADMNKLPEGMSRLIEQAARKRTRDEVRALGFDPNENSEAHLIRIIKWLGSGDHCSQANPFYLAVTRVLQALGIVPIGVRPPEVQDIAEVTTLAGQRGYDKSVRDFATQFKEVFNGKASPSPEKAMP